MLSNVIGRGRAEARGNGFSSNVRFGWVNARSLMSALGRKQTLG
jgi:hypothetical protein